MKNKHWILICITAGFLILLMGIFIGRNMTGNYVPVDKISNLQTQESTQSASVNNGKININTATSQQLQLLPGIGAATAEKIIAYRETVGEFTSLESLMNVSGIGEKKFAQLKPYIKITDSDN